MGDVFSLYRDAELGRRIERLEAENAAIKDALRAMLGGVRPYIGAPNPFDWPNLSVAQAVWDAVFGAKEG